MSKKKPSWRAALEIHPATNLFPMMRPDELRALGEDIKQKGLSVPVILWAESKDAAPKLLDGRNRLDAMEVVGLTVLDHEGKSLDCIPVERVYGGDPYAHVLSFNAHRRHLTPARKREVIAKMLKVQPDKSNRAIAKQTETDHKTVGNMRREMEGRGEIPHVSAVKDIKGRKQATRKARRSADDAIADQNAQAAAVADCAHEPPQQTRHVGEHVQNPAHDVEVVEPKQSDIERDLPEAARLVIRIISRDAIAPGYALAVARGIAAYLESGFPEMPEILNRTA